MSLEIQKFSRRLLNALSQVCKYEVESIKATLAQLDSPELRANPILPGRRVSSLSELRKQLVEELHQAEQLLTSARYFFTKKDQ